MTVGDAQQRRPQAQARPATKDARITVRLSPEDKSWFDAESAALGFPTATLFRALALNYRDGYTPRLAPPRDENLAPEITTMIDDTVAALNEAGLSLNALAESVNTEHRTGGAPDAVAEREAATIARVTEALDGTASTLCGTLRDIEGPMNSRALDGVRSQVLRIGVNLRQIDSRTTDAPAIRDALRSLDEVHTLLGGAARP
ncbi:MAG: hypothetical protein ACI38U_02160 [Corynebacterium sp.]|uniref:hypothetical protein n=1 Tax=Corynebacterium sp. TaxID=1720 RepID=UPI003EFCA791